MSDLANNLLLIHELKNIGDYNDVNHMLTVDSVNQNVLRKLLDSNLVEVVEDGVMIPFGRNVDTCKQYVVLTDIGKITHMAMKAINKPDFVIYNQEEE